MSRRERQQRDPSHRLHANVRRAAKSLVQYYYTNHHPLDLDRASSAAAAQIHSLMLALREAYRDRERERNIEHARSMASPLVVDTLTKAKQFAATPGVRFVELEWGTPFNQLRPRSEVIYYREDDTDDYWA